MISKALRRLAILVALLPGTVFASAIQARLEITPATVLPGLPAMFTVSLANRGTRPESVATYIRLTATPQSGKPFIVLWGGVNEETLLTGEYEVLLRPGDSRDYFFPVSETLAMNEAFWDERLTVPGTYDLRMEIGQSFDIRSNTARLIVAQPSGDDLQVWKRMQEITKGKGWPTNLWIGGTDVTAPYPRSQYAKASVFYRSPERKDVLAAIAGLSGPLRDDLRLFLIHKLQVERQFKEANQQLAQLEREASSPYARTRARQIRDEIRVKTTIQKMDPQGRAAYQPLVPLQPCKTGDGELKIGYHNKNQWPIVKKIGRENSFAPSPIDRGQPTTFESGRFKEVFTIALRPGETVTWTLDGTKMTYRLGNLVRCAED
jgi:hypothetical protein